MIDYQTDSSPFFLTNKIYCEIIEQSLKKMNLAYCGFCNSYGYEIETSLKRGNLIYHLKCFKHQSTQNGQIIPVDALDYSGCEITVTGLNKKYKLEISKNKIRRLFISTKFKEKILSPYFIKYNFSPDSELEMSLIKQILDNRISKFKLNRGKIKLKIHMAIEDPLNFILNIEKIVLNWA